MNKLQVRMSMKRCGIVAESISGRGNDWEVRLSSSRDVAKFQADVCSNASGYTTGFGSIVLRPNYEDRGDFNDKSSRHHY